MKTDNWKTCARGESHLLTNHQQRGNFCQKCGLLESTIKRLKEKCDICLAYMPDCVCNKVHIKKDDELWKLTKTELINMVLKLRGRASGKCLTGGCENLVNTSGYCDRCEELLES